MQKNMATLDTVLRLQALFQKAQQTDVTYRLSEQNCVEVVKRLTEANLLSVLFTLDGKEYVTPQQLEKELLQELRNNGGRVTLADLQSTLNIDIVFIEEKAQALCRGQSDLTLLNGELFSEQYFTSISEEINESLQEIGQLYIGDLCQRFNLPVEFLQQLIEARLEKLIFGMRDAASGTLYTEAFIGRQRAVVRGILCATTRPTPLQSLLQLYPLQEKLLYGLVEGLISNGSIVGKLRGGRDKATYVPDLYQRMQADSVLSFYRQNGYIEMEGLRKLEIDDPRGFMKKMFPDGHILLSQCFVAPTIIDQVDASIDEALLQDSWINVATLVPSPLNDNDIEALISNCTSIKSRPLAEKTLKGQPLPNSVVIFPSHYVTTNAFLESCYAQLEPPTKEAARRVGAAPTSASASSETNAPSESRKGKAPANKKDNQDEDDDWGNDNQSRSKKSARRKPVAPTPKSGKAATATAPTDKLPIEQLLKVLTTRFPDADEEFLMEIIEHHRQRLLQSFNEQVQAMKAPSLFSSAERKKAQEATRDQVDELRQNILQFQRGIKLFEDANAVAQLERYLIREIGGTIADVLLTDLARMANLIPLEQEGSNNNETNISLVVEKRDEFINQLSPGDAKAIQALNHSVANAKTLDEFLQTLETLATPLGLYWKKTDKKRERQILFKQRQALLTQLRATQEPSLILHLVALLLFQQVNKAMLHAPGRFVPQILAHLAASGELPKETVAILTDMQTLVIKSLGSNKHDAATRDKLMVQAEIVRQLGTAGSEASGSSNDQTE